MVTVPRRGLLPSHRRQIGKTPSEMTERCPPYRGVRLLPANREQMHSQLFREAPVSGFVLIDNPIGDRERDMATKEEAHRHTKDPQASDYQAD